MEENKKVVYQRGQWSIVIEGAADEKLDENGGIPIQGYRIENRGPDGKLRFYMVVPGPHGQPCFRVEPDLAFPVHPGLTYQNVKGEPLAPQNLKRIGGIIAGSRDGEMFQILHRFSLSNAAQKGISYGFRKADGAFLIGDEVFWLQALVDKDKNRVLDGYDGFFGPNRPEFVRVFELEDMGQFFLGGKL